MARRLAALLFGVALFSAGLAAAPCAGRATCAMAAASQKDCCNQKAGIAAPRCCGGEQRVQRAAPPAAPERPVQLQLTASAMYAAPAALALAEPARPARAERAAPGTHPPGGTLIAQHTSLLL